MKTRKHGKGMTHKQVVEFSNRLAACAQCEVSPYYTYGHGFDEGYAAACKYFAHQLREILRYCEWLNE